MKNMRLWTGALALLVVFGCGGSGSSPVVAPDPVVRFINAAPNSVALDLTANEAAIGSSVAYLGSSPNFQSFIPGDYDLTCVEHGLPETEAVAAFTMSRDANILSVAYGLVTPPNDELDKRLNVSTFTFDRTRPNGTKARLVLVNAFNRSLGNLNHAVDFRNPGDTPLVNEANIDFGAARGFLIDAGTQTFVARRNGTEFEITPQITFTFEAGKIYAAIVSGIEDAVGAQAPKITFIELQTR